MFFGKGIRCNISDFFPKGLFGELVRMGMGYAIPTIMLATRDAEP